MKLILSIALSFVLLASLAQSNEEIQNYIKQLGHEDYKVREYAESRIIQAGKRSIPFLKEALKAGDPEITWRAETLIEEIEAINSLEEEVTLNEEEKEVPVEKEIEELKPQDVEEMEEFENNPNNRRQNNRRQGFRQQFSMNLGGTVGSFTIMKNGEIFSVKTLRDGSFKVSTESKDANGKRVAKTYTFKNEAEFKEQNPDLYKQYKKASEGITFERMLPQRRQNRSQPGQGGGNSLFGNQQQMKDLFGAIQDLQKLQDPNADMDKILERNMERMMRQFAQGNPEMEQMFKMQKEIFKMLNGNQGGRANSPLFRQFDRNPRQRRQAINNTPKQNTIPGLKIGAMSEVLRSQTSKQGVVVKLALGKAKEIGLNKYDIILSINGAPTPDVTTAQRVLQSLKVGQQVTLQVMRKMQETTITFNF